MLWLVTVRLRGGISFIAIPAKPFLWSTDHPSYTKTYLQFIVRVTLAQIIHGHNLHHQARPAREVLRPLAPAGLRVVLLPREARLLPALVDRVDEVGAELRVELPRAGLVGALVRRDVLSMRVSDMERNVCIVMGYARKAGRRRDS